ncbi:hypothetical protein BKA64DRAFT_97957 [Cadophora sp. MPI-SDFR-AT-0126]|nr:hypothetical protein BKA64DRAFT_97957 [Leotiomycetes sp. MPI-SDFR-AT-0126]
MYVVYTHVVPPGLLVLITNKMCWTLKSYSHCMTLKLIAFWPIHMHAHEMGNRTLMSVRAVDMMGLYLRPGQDGRQWSLEAAYIPGHYKYMFNVRFFTRESCQEVISEKETSSRYNSTSGGKLPSRMDFGPFLGQPGEILAERCFSIQVVTQTGTKTPWPNSIRLGSGAPVFTPRLLHDYHFKYGGQFVAMHIFVDDLETQLSGVCEHWSDELSGMNKKLGATLTDILDENTAHELMFDDKNFKRSKLYFTSQQLYRIFERCIGETLVELEMLQRDFLECEDMPGTKIDIKNVDGNIQTLDDHWTKAMAEPTKQLELILVRIKNKQEEVESLRDGLFNATSVREASRGTEIAEISIRQNHYLFVFTIMTVIYLPLGFVTSIFGMHLFDTTDSGVVAARPKFYITLVVLSVSTYITAGLAYWLVRSRKKNDSGSSNGLSNMLSKKQEQYADTELSEDGARNLEGGLSALLRKGIRKRKEKDIGTGRAKGKGKEASAMV